MTSSNNEVEDEDVTKEIGKEVGNMNINNHSHTQQQQQQQQYRRPPTPIVICDAWYGFPHQKRPRKERVNAVCKQIFNFHSWRNEYKNKCKDKCKDTIISEKNEANANMKILAPSPLSESECKVYVIGRGNDIQAIENRMDELLRDRSKAEADDDDDDEEEELKDALSKCSFLQDQSLEDLVRSLKSERESESGESNECETGAATAGTGTAAATGTRRKDPNLNVAVYLSPDVETRLSTTKQPPRIVVVGMLVDRKVQANRSKQRVESLEVPVPAPASNLNGDSSVTPVPDGDNIEQATETATETTTADNALIEGARLPLEVLNVSDLGTDEPLNIDTVMEMIQRWWFNLDDIHTSNSCCIDSIQVDTSIISNVNSETQLTSICRDALARSMLTHRQRHPNRTIHGGASTM